MGWDAKRDRWNGYDAFGVDSDTLWSCVSSRRNFHMRLCGIWWLLDPHAFLGKDIQADELIQKVDMGWDAKRDRWNGYDATEYRPLFGLVCHRAAIFTCAFAVFGGCWTRTLSSIIPFQDQRVPESTPKARRPMDWKGYSGRRTYPEGRHGVHRAAIFTCAFAVFGGCWTRTLSSIIPF
jgi:hypothetical protein